jgi:hypothetical protein
VLTFLWVQNASDYRAERNDLYLNGHVTFGSITKVVINNLNEGNIQSWDIHYKYEDQYSRERTGKINAPKKKQVLISDSIYVINSEKKSEFHIASLNKSEYKPLSMVSAMFRIDNIFRVAPILILGILFLTQLLYLYGNRKTS